MEFEIEEMLFSDYESEILDLCEDDFDDIIKERGRDYYNRGNVLSCIKTDCAFIAKVKGSMDSPYIVEVYYDCEDDYVELNCNCPCDFPCKHEYAVLLSINNREYNEIELKPYIKQEQYDLRKIIKQIPAEELKKYLLNNKGFNSTIFDKKTFEEHFKTYLPTQKYEYYYNNLYNELMLNDYELTLKIELDTIKEYISNNEFNEPFKIIKAIIEAYNDSDKLNSDEDLFDLFSKLGMFLRIINRKCDEELKQEITDWCIKLEDQNYYNNFYLEDIVLCIK